MRDCPDWVRRHSEVAIQEETKRAIRLTPLKPFKSNSAKKDLLQMTHSARDMHAYFHTALSRDDSLWLDSTSVGSLSNFYEIHAFTFFLQQNSDSWLTIRGLEFERRWMSHGLCMPCMLVGMRIRFVLHHISPSCWTIHTSWYKQKSNSTLVSFFMLEWTYFANVWHERKKPIQEHRLSLTSPCDYERCAAPVASFCNRSSLSSAVQTHQDCL
jgi:hypothetical protein